MPVFSRVEISEDRLRAALTGPDGDVTRYVLRVTRNIRNRAVLYCPVDTGNLRASIATGAVRTEGSTVVGTVGTPVEYAIYVHEGTAPHEIRPTTPGGVLAWGGRPPTRFATRVNHPGTKPQPFLRRAMEDVLGEG